MTRRDVVRAVFEGRCPPYVPWSFGFTEEARARLIRHVGGEAHLDALLNDHLLMLGNGIGFFDDIGGGFVRDVFGVVWDRRVDRDIGVIADPPLTEPSLAKLRLPNPEDPRFFNDIPGALALHGDRFRYFNIGFSLYERAWTLRGMEALMMDFIEHPCFVRDLLRTLADYNIAQARKALSYDIDVVHFGDDWGQQQGLQMGPQLWREFIYPELKRMYAAVHAAGRFVSIHSCGDVDELFDDLVGIGVNCFNPFQPEVMDVHRLHAAYRGRLAFFGGLSTQRTLPYGTPEEVRAESRALLAMGREGGYLFAPAHAVEGDVPLDNILAFIEEAHAQPGYAG